MTSGLAETLGMTKGLTLADSAKDIASARVAALIERSRKGDERAFEELMVCYQRKVVSIATRVLGNREDAFDAAQEVFFRVHKNLHRVES